MRGPQRLLETDDLPSQGRRLLEALPKTGVLPAELDVVVEAELTKAAALAPSGSAAVKLWLLGAVVVAVGTWWLLRPISPEAPELPEPISYQAASPVRHQRFVPQTPKLETSDAVAAPAAPASADRAAPVRPKPVPSLTPRPPNLAEELKLLDAARFQLERSSDVALSHVRRHGERFPNGQLADLRDYLEVQVFMRKDEPQKVQRLSRAFFEAHGTSALTEELREALKEYRDAGK